MEKQLKKEQMPPYALARKIIQEQHINKIHLRRINDCICIFDLSYMCFIPVDDAQLETRIIDYLANNESVIEVKITKKYVQETVYFIKRALVFNEDPAEYQGWMGFRNGFLNASNFNFFDYNDPATTFSPAQFPPITFSFQQKYDPTILNNLKTSEAISMNTPNHLFQYMPIYFSQYIKTDNIPYFSQFLNRISGSNFALMDRIWEMIGYILTPDTNAKAFFLLQGVPNSGKSVLGRLIESFFPKWCVTSLSANRLGGQYSPAKMDTSRLNISMDLSDGKVSSTAIANIKMITGGDLITHEEKYKDAKSSRWICKLLFSTNHPLELKKYDPAFLERIICIPFKYEISKAEQNPDLFHYLLNEREYIINTALFFYQRLRMAKYKFSGTGLDTLEPKIKYTLGPNEVVEEFVKERCVFTPPESGRTTTKALYEAYKQYCSSNNFSITTEIGFSQRLIKLCGDKIEDSKWREHKRPPQNGYKGIVLVDADTTDAGVDYDAYNDDYDEESDYSDASSAPIYGITKQITI